ncbi:hypothetical protein CCR90_13580 [Rhodovulum sulfidophilum]|nr:hypothetical protein [Rhodovulum sulfidophilum]
MRLFNTSSALCQRAKNRANLGGDIARCVLERMRGETDFVVYGLLTGKPVEFGAGVRAKRRRRPSR